MLARLFFFGGGGGAGGVRLDRQGARSRGCVAPAVIACGEPGSTVSKIGLRTHCATERQKGRPARSTCRGRLLSGYSCCSLQKPLGGYCGRCF